MVDVFQRTLIVASVTVLIAAVVGVLFAIVFSYMRVFASNVMQVGLAVPVAIPGIWRVIIGPLYLRDADNGVDCLESIAQS